MEEDTPDGLGDHSNGEEIEDVIVGIDLIEAEVGESVDRKLSVVTPEMIDKAVRHVKTAKAQRQYLRDSVTAANLDTNIMQFILISIMFLSVTTPRILNYLFLEISSQEILTTSLPKVSMSLEWLTWPINTMILLNQ